MKIGVVGGGIVGRAIARTYLEDHEVLVWDIIPERCTAYRQSVLDCDLVFVCLPTPQGKEGRLDLSCLHDFFGSISPTGINFILKSTVPIGTTTLLRTKYHLSNLVNSPEFLTARCAMTDALLPSRNIIGGYWDGKVGSNCCYMLLKLYQERFPGVPVFQVTPEESEAVKLFVNGFFAVKVAFFNEIRTLADSLKLSWDHVLEGMLSDGRIAHSHTRVPGPDGQRGFGGACLPKDLEQLHRHLEDAGLKEYVTGGTVLRNVQDRERPPQRAGGVL